MLVKMMEENVKLKKKNVLKPEEFIDAYILLKYLLSQIN